MMKLSDTMKTVLVRLVEAGGEGVARSRWIKTVEALEARGLVKIVCRRNKVTECYQHVSENTVTYEVLDAGLDVAVELVG